MRSSAPEIHGTDSPLPQEEAIEQEINRGQLEELIEQGKLELKLVDKYYEWRMWEAVEKMNMGREELSPEASVEEPPAK